MRAYVIILLIVVVSVSHAQEYSITFSTNAYVPVASRKRMYPPLWVKSEYEPSFLFGGFAIGASRTSAPKGVITLRYSATITRMAYWEEFLEFRDEYNQDLGKCAASSTDYILALSALAHYKLSEHFHVGGGLGAHTLLMSRLHLRQNFGQTSDASGKNKFYKPFMPVIPIELSFKWSGWAMNFRYEQSLLKRYKSSIAEYRSDRYGLLILEVSTNLP